MALLFTDGFDHYGSRTYVLHKWEEANLGSGCDASNTGGRRNKGCLQTIGGASGSQNYHATKLLGNTAIVFTGVAFQANGLGSTQRIFTFFDGTTQHAALLRDGNGFLYVVGAAGTELTGGRATTPLRVGVWYYIEMKFKPSNSSSSGDLEVRLDGVTCINPNAGQDVMATANAYTNKVRLAGVNSGSYCWYDDFYVCDDTGSINNGFLGDIRVDTYLPDADGSSLEWTPSTGTAHYALVDEATVSLTDYVQTTIQGGVDLYSYQPSASLPGDIFGVQVSNLVVKLEEGEVSTRHVVKISSTEYPQGDIAAGFTASYNPRMLELNPATSLEWTTSDIDAAEFGAELR